MLGPSLFQTNEGSAGILEGGRVGLSSLAPHLPSRLTASCGHAQGSQPGTLRRGHAQPAASVPGRGGLGQGDHMISTAASCFSPEWVGGWVLHPHSGGQESSEGLQGEGLECCAESKGESVGDSWRERRLSREMEGGDAACKWAPKGGGKGLFISGPRVTQARDFLLWFGPQRNLLPRMLGSPTFQPHPGAEPAPSRCPF